MASLPTTPSTSTLLPPKRFKIVMIGDPRVGKTAFVQRHFTGEFLEEYHYTLGVEATPLQFRTTKGSFLLNMYDWSMGPALEELFETYYDNADAALVFFDLSNASTYANVAGYIEQFRKLCPNAPILIIGNKKDRNDRQVSSSSQISLTLPVKNIEYLEISVKTGLNFEKPLLRLLQLLTGDTRLRLADPPQSGVRRRVEAQNQRRIFERDTTTQGPEKAVTPVPEQKIIELSDAISSAFFAMKKINEVTLAFPSSNNVELNTFINELSTSSFIGEDNYADMLRYLSSVLQASPTQS